MFPISGPVAIFRHQETDHWIGSSKIHEMTGLSRALLLGQSACVLSNDVRLDHSD